MRKYQNIALFVYSLVFSLYSFAQQPLSQINILSFTVKNKLPADVSTWGTLPGSIILTAQRIPQSAIQGIKLVVQIKQGGAKICGILVDASPMLDFNAVKTFTGAELNSYLSNCNTLKPGSYTICAQFYNLDRYPISKEMCKEFRVEDAVQNDFCNPPQNINPTEGKIFTDKDFLLPKTFTWTPFITSNKTLITYRLTAWEIEEGQSEAQAIYDNFPVLQEDVKGITRYTSKPSTWEHRNATYVWRVEALDQEGKPLCKTNTSKPTQFKIVLQEANSTQDSTKNEEENNCCKDSIKNVSKSITVVGTNLNIVQNFTTSPNNITKINAEIFFVTESATDTSCRKCTANEAAVWNFVPMNKVIWNSGLPNNGSPNNASGFYPAQNIVWFCNAQGNLKFDLKIALPGIASLSCKRTGKIGIKYKFTDKDCKTCEQTVIYDYSIN